jgi:hypothetical protein
MPVLSGVVHEENAMTEETPNRVRWSRHPDAYPDVSHCPSCGAAVDVPWAGDDPQAMDRPPHSVRCGQCRRDLRLPRRAVKDQLCLLCKVPGEESAAEVTYHRLETGERLCSNCAGDLRAFKYELACQHFVADYLTDDHRQAVTDALAGVADAYDGEYTFTANANARYGRLEPEVDDELTVEDVLEDADVEELREEIGADQADEDGQ